MKSFDGIKEEIIRISEKESNPIENHQELYHYTNCNALLNILKENEIWLSQREYMNDVFDRSYASQILKEVFQNVYGKNGENKYQDFTNRMMPEFHKNYVFSLTTERDLMSQWAYYGGNNGYCVSFNVKQITDIFKSNNFGLQSGKIIYNKSNQLELFTTMITYLKDLEGNNGKISQNLYLENSSKINSLIVLFHVLTKQENNYTEKEYRIVINNPPNQHFQNRKGIILPYTKLKFEEVLPIKEIMVGPGINDEIAIDGLKQYIDSLVLNISLKKSALQIR